MRRQLRTRAIDNKRPRNCSLLKVFALITSVQLWGLTRMYCEQETHTHTTKALYVEMFTSIRSDRPIPPACKAWSKLLAGFGGSVHLITDNSFPVIPGTGFKVTVLDIDVAKLPTWSEICEVMARSREVLITGYFNNDIFPDPNFLKVMNTLQHLSTSLKYTRIAKPYERFKVRPHFTQGWFAVATRIDVNLRNRTGLTHTYGGYDIWLWNNIPDDNSILGKYFGIPKFHIARPYFDVWFLSAAIKIGHRHVIDISPAVKILHVQHKRLFKYWLESFRVANNDTAWNENHDLAFKTYCDGITRGGKCWKYKMGTGTVCETPLQMTKDLTLRERDESVPYKCLKRRRYHLSDEEYLLVNYDTQIGLS